MDLPALLDPELAPQFALIPDDAGVLTADTLAIRREWLSTPRPDEPTPVVTPRTEWAPGRDGAPDVRLLVFDPPARRGTSVLLYVHGGGMVIGNAEVNAALNAELAVKHDMLVVSVDYRLAPETRFPGPQEDCYAAVAWLHQNAERLKFDIDRILLWGDSAGGGLAAALAQIVRDRGEFALRGQVLVYPMLDHRTGTPDSLYDNRFAGTHIWTAADNAFGWQSLRGDYGVDDERAGWFSPSLASSLEGLAPAFIATGAIDLFVDEDVDYARRLMNAGVPVELHVYPGATHGFDWVTDAAVAKQYKQDFHRAIAGFLAR